MEEATVLPVPRYTSGSGIERIYQEVEAESLKLNEIASRIISDEFTVLSDNKNGVSVWNSLSFERTETVTLPKEFEGGAVTADGSITTCNEVR